jgi:hypothetical protein
MRANRGLSEHRRGSIINVDTKLLAKDSAILLRTYNPVPPQVSKPFPGQGELHLESSLKVSMIASDGAQ